MAFSLPFCNQTKETEYYREGQPVLSNTLAGGDPFHFTSLTDKYGTYLGYTIASGATGKVIFDYFCKSSTRLSYNALVIGEMGAGKSTLMNILSLLLDKTDGNITLDENDIVKMDTT